MGKKERFRKMPETEKREGFEGHWMSLDCSHPLVTWTYTYTK